MSALDVFAGLGLLLASLTAVSVVGTAGMVAMARLERAATEPRSKDR